jgi:hypothetical protein
MVRRPTEVQDSKVISLLRKGIPRKEVANKLSVSYWQVVHAVRRHTKSPGMRHAVVNF